MRWAALSGLVLCGILLLGCGDDGSAPPTASAGGAPPVPGGPPAGPPAPGGEAPPADNPPPAETPPAAPPADTSPPEPAPAPLPGGEGGQPTDPNNPGDPNENGDGTPRRPPPPRTLRDQSIAAFRGGQDVMGYKLLNAHFAVVPSAKEELAQKMAWVPGLMRPALAPRIGIAVQIVDAPLNFKGDPMPIGSTSLTTAVDQMQQAEAADGAIGRTGRMSKFGRGRKGPTLDFSEKSKTDQTQNWPAEQQIHYYLGDFGEWLVDALHERMDTGEYGPVLKELVKQARRAPQRRDPNNPDGQPGGTDFAGGQPGEGDGGGGPMPPGGGRGRGGRGGGGGLGGAGGGAGGVLADPTGSGAGEDKSRRWSGKGEKEAVNVAAIKQVSPCVLWLGKIKDEDRDELLKRAEAVDCDILALFTMTLNDARTGSFINNKTTLRLQCYRPNNPGSKWIALPNYTAEPLVNLEVERWRQKDEKGTDPVEREVLKSLEALDKALKPTPLPEAVTAERAKKRITDLVAQKPDEPLPVIVEARYYAAKGLMTNDEFVEVAKTLLGEQGYERLAARAKETNN